MIRVLVSGCLGRMGRNLVENLKGSEEIEVVGGIEAEECVYLGQDIGDVLGIGWIGGKIYTDISQSIELCDILVEFTNPIVTLEHLRIAQRFRKGAVIGTTGFSPEEMREIWLLSANIPIVVSPNMSVGINLLFKLAWAAATVLGQEFDIEIVETHHNKKLDAPSGTAKKLLEILADVRKKKPEECASYGRYELSGERKPDEIGVMSVRGGDVVGEHTVLFLGKGERLELIHRAYNRLPFVRGTIQAIKFLSKIKPGLYDMDDVLGIKI